MIRKNDLVGVALSALIAGAVLWFFFEADIRNLIVESVVRRWPAASRAGPGDRDLVRLDRGDGGPPTADRRARRHGDGL
jgi:hypothetical protein